MLHTGRVLSAASVILAIACSDSASTTPSSVASDPARGVVEGAVYARRNTLSRTLPPGDDGTRIRLRDVEVLTIDGRESNTSVTTDAMGKYRLELPVGPFRLRWSKTGYVARESAPGTVERGVTITMPDVVLDGPQWTVEGLVTDGRGQPAAGASVVVRGGAVFPLAWSSSDAAGRFSLASNLVVPALTDIVAAKEGYREARAQFTCCAADTELITITLRIVRIVRVALTGPATLRVGQSAQLMYEVEFEDGSRETGSPLTAISSSDPAIVRTAPRMVEGVAPGTATITWIYYAAGVPVVPLQIRVIQ